MATYANQTVVGVFDERGLVDRVVGDLENAGFSADQIHYSGPGQNPDNNFWRGIRKLFSRDKTTSRDPVANELKSLGLSDDEIRHYENEYDIGHAVVAVNAPGREEEALAIMRANGAHK